MSKPKHPGGRPRRFAWSAHDARRVARRIEIAHNELAFVGRLLQDQPELVHAMNAGVPAALLYYLRETTNMERALRELRAVVLSETAAEWAQRNA